MRALDIAATGMDAQQTRVETISNNLANMSTTAYSPRRAEFVDLHYQTTRGPGSVNAATGEVLPTGLQLGLGVRTAAVSVERSEGALRQTGGELDVAIEGGGFIEVLLPSGASAYTRDGALKRSSDGQLVTSEGYAVEPSITIPDDATAVTVTPDGEVFARFADQVAEQSLGNLTLATFVNHKGLEALGGNLFAETAASGPPSIGDPGEDGRGTLRQGFLEQSSVDAVREITELIEAQRAYEMNAKVITAADQMLGATVQIR
ncbi:MAG: flagellar basal-body rod protein FlgG [Pseudomonadota bacterium]